MANHMPEIAKMLGVELGKKFTIEDSDGEIMGVAVIEESEFKLLEYNVNYTNSWLQYTLENLLTGKYTIKRKPWKPKMGEYYWCIDPNGESSKCSWMNTSGGGSNYKLGNCYRTREEAEANRDKWVAFYASDDVLEV